MTTRLGGVPATAPDLPGAACFGQPVDLFFPPDDRGGRIPAVRMALLRGAARAYCRDCPVRAECRAAGESTQYEVWGGVLRRPKGDPIDLLAVTR